MSTLQNDFILDRLMEEYYVVPCNDGVGTWEVHHVDGTVHETYETIEKAEKGRETLIRQAFDDMCQ